MIKKEGGGCGWDQREFQELEQEASSGVEELQWSGL